MAITPLVQNISEAAFYHADTTSPIAYLAPYLANAVSSLRPIVPQHTVPTIPALPAKSQQRHSHSLPATPPKIHVLVLRLPPLIHPIVNGRYHSEHLYCVPRVGGKVLIRSHDAANRSVPSFVEMKDMMCIDGETPCTYSALGAS